MSRSTVLYLLLFKMLVLGPIQHCLGQTGPDTLSLYALAMEQAADTQEFKNYMVWAEGEMPFQSNEVLYGSEVFFNCTKCGNYKSEQEGVKDILPELTPDEDKGKYKAIAFFTEIQNQCFSIIIKTTFNNDPTYEGGVFVGKQVYFQFFIEKDALVTCSKMTLRNN